MQKRMSFSTLVLFCSLLVSRGPFSAIIAHSHIRQTVGFYARIWWLDAVGGLLLSLVVIVNWSGISVHHVRNLTGFSAQPDERNLLLYLTMRFATAIRQIQNLRAYHAGDKLFVEVDIVLSANTPLKDSHDLSEVLTYFLESVPIVDRAFVHVDYTSYNAPTHILKQSAS
jgi:divalent metal cation (Fe/Co/Zn/Cd) transporter